jgi:hypothetical protein
VFELCELLLPEEATDGTNRTRLPASKKAGRDLRMRFMEPSIVLMKMHWHTQKMCVQKKTLGEETSGAQKSEDVVCV